VPFHFKSFRARLLAFVFGLLVLVQIAVLLAVNAANVREARRHIDEALELTAAALRRSLHARDQILLEKAQLLSADFAFKNAFATGEHGTLLSALENHQARIGGSVMMLLAMDGSVLADTLHPGAHGVPSLLLPLVSAAMDTEFGEASSIQAIDGEPYQLAVVPLFTPEPSAWIVIGFALDDSFAEELRRETRTHVSLLWRQLRGWAVFCSTLTSAARPTLERNVAESRSEPGESISIRLAGDEFVSWIAPVSNTGSDVVAVLQRSLDEALRPFLRLRAVLLFIFAAGLVLSLASGILLASRVTRPVASLALGARRIAAGNYTDPVEVQQTDELGALATSFNHMMKGLAERDRVRDMLGKVVSPEIAEELLSHEIELGGEERTVSILFSDIRDFTTVAENETPPRLVEILNTYLTWLTGIVEKHGGVVEQYVGDAVMALYGAPLQHPDDPLRAVRVALEIGERLPEINREIAKYGLAPFAVGVGIHTDVVVAGNIGSPNRLNYKVVGDGVNLASRLEGLTKRYRVGAIVSESTRAGCPGVAFRELDRVRVKGRRAPVTIYEPLGFEAELPPAIAELLPLHADAITRFRARDWDGAVAAFDDLARREPGTRLYELYRERVARLRSEPPAADWDGTVTYDEK
jgi:adenylate cyclase